MYQGRSEEGDKRKRIKKELITITILFTLINLPFITFIQYTNLDIFIDSFLNPDEYQYIKIDKEKIKLNEENSQYLILQKPTHPDFTLKNGDYLLFMNYDGDLMCDEIDYIKNIGNIKKIYFKHDSTYDKNYPIFIDYVIGKILFKADNNPWTTFSLKAWDASINNLNLHAIFNQ